MSGSGSIDWTVAERPLTAKQAYWQRRRARDIVLATPPDGKVEPAVADIISVKRLIQTFHDLKRNGGQAPGLDGMSYRHLSHSQAADILRTFSASLKADQYTPKQGLTVQIPKSSGGTRQLTIRDLPFRVLAASLNSALTPFWENLFLPGSFGFRPGRSAWMMLASLEATMVARNLRVLAIDDVRGAFDHVDINLLMDYHRRHIKNPGLLKLIELVIRGGENKLIGIDQGSAYSPTALNLYLHNLHESCVQVYSKSSAWFRYADNLVYATPSVHEGEQILNQVAELLKGGNLTLKGQNGPPSDLSKGNAQLLGFTLGWGGNGLTLDLGDQAWTKLTENLLKAHETANPQATAENAVLGWMASHAPAFTNPVGPATYAQLQKVLAENGFHEAISLAEITQQVESSRKHWSRIREDAASALAGSL